MKLPAFLLRRLARLTDTLPARRAPDFVIGSDPAQPYLRRWWVIPRNPLLNIYLHQFCRPDDDRALHSHPWMWNVSVLLRGCYVEHLPKDRLAIRTEGAVVARWGSAWHRVALWPFKRWNRASQSIEAAWRPCWTLFITGPRVRGWGFACPQGFVPWQAFTAPGNPGGIGKGCDQ